MHRHDASPSASGGRQRHELYLACGETRKDFPLAAVPELGQGDARMEAERAGEGKAPPREAGAHKQRCSPTWTGEGTRASNADLIAAG